MGGSLHGRHSECEMIDRCLGQAKSGRAAVLSIVGDPGTGKTALCDYAGTTSAGFLCARMAAVDGEADLALSGLSLLLRPLAPYTGTVAGSHRQVLDAVIGVSGLCVEDRFSLAAATLALLSAAAEAQPLLVVVDDAQWLDEPSAKALSFALRRLDADAVVVILASRNPATRLLSSVGEKVIELSGLDPAGGMALLTERNPDFAKPIAEQVVTATGGNPLALIEVAAHLSPDQRQGRQPLPDPLPVGRDLTDLYQQRLMPLPTDCKLALAVLAAAGSAPSLIASALDRLGVETAELEPAEQAGVLTVADTTVGYQFPHPLLRAAALELLAPAERRGVHEALAHAAQGDPERYATHVAAAATGPSFHVADALIAAADQAERCSGLAAPSILERAALLTPPGDVASHRRIRAAQALALGGQIAAAIEHLDHVISTTTDDDIRSEAALLRALMTFWEPSAAQAVETIRREAEHVAAVNPQRAAAALALTSITLSIRGDISGGLELAERAYRLVRSAGVDELQVVGVLAAARISAGHRLEGAALITDGVLTRWLDRAARRGGRDPVELAVGTQPLLWSEQYERAEQFCGAMIDTSRRHASPYALAHLTGTFSEVLWWTGRWDEAVGVGEEALVLCQQTGQDILATVPATVLARLYACRGDEARCRDLASTALSVARSFGHVFVRLMAYHALGLCELSAGRPHAAVAPFLKCEQIATQIGLQEVCVVPYGADLIETLIRCGDHEQATRLLQLHTERANRVDSKWGLATTARCQAMLAGGEDAEVLFKEALAGHPVGSFDEARTRLCWGEHLRRRNERRRSRDQLERAATVFDALGAQPWDQRTRSELHAIGAQTAPAPPPALQTLTAKELQVALAVGHGMSNRDAAAALFVSSKTVEYHLGRVYAKLGVSTRSQLVNYLNTTMAGGASRRT